MDFTRLDPQKASILDEFRAAVKDCKLPISPDKSDVYLLRWLIAREFDLVKSEKMLRASLAWRKLYKVDDLLKDFKPPQVFNEYFSTSFFGYDKFHHPLWVVRFGSIDVKGLLLSAKKKDFLNYIFCFVESSVRYSREYQEKHNLPASFMSQSTLIFDLEGLSMRTLTYRPAVDACLQAIQFYEGNYPEQLRRVFVVNAPKIFNIAIALIKPFLNETTASKIRMLAGSDASSWRKAILEDCNADQFPAHYGGSLADPDGNPLCITMMNNMGGLVPKSYYFNDASNKKNNDNKKNLAVSYGGKEKLKFDVKTPASSLRWQFYSEEGDIAFAVYQKVNGVKTVIVPKDRVDSHIAAEEGEIRVDPGQCNVHTRLLVE